MMTFKASPNLYSLTTEAKMSLKCPSLPIHKVPVLGNKKAENPTLLLGSQNGTSPALRPTHVLPCPYGGHWKTPHCVMAGQPRCPARKKKKTKQTKPRGFWLPFPILTPRICRQTRQPRGKESRWARRKVSS